MNSHPMKRHPVVIVLIVGLLGVCCYLIFKPWLMDRIDESLQRESRQQFRDTVTDVSAVTDDTIVSESQREIDTNGMCFSAEVQQILGTNRSFDAVLAEYSADLPDIDFNSSAECEKVFSGPEDSALAITELSTDELNCYGIEQVEYRTYYRVILLYSRLCGPGSDVFARLLLLHSVACSSGSYTWSSQACLDTTNSR